MRQLGIRNFIGIGLPFAKRRGGWAADAPTGLSATVVSDTRIDLAWTNVDTKGDGVSIERSADGVTYAEIVTVALGVAVYSNTGLTENTKYYYRVRAYKGSTYSDYTSVVDATTITEELRVYITDLTTPLSAGQKTLINNFVKSLKTGLSVSKISEAFDVMYILAGETAESSLRNLVKRAHDATAVNSPTFTALEGFTGNRTTNYINSNYNPTTEAVNLSQNNASITLYIRQFGLDSMNYNVGATTGDTVRLGENGANVFYRLFQGSSDFATTTAGGCHIMSRSASDVFKVYKNKTGIISKTTVSVSPHNSNLLILKEEGFLSSNQISCCFFGKSFTESEAGVITDTFEAYMDANGKGIIP